MAQAARVIEATIYARLVRRPFSRFDNQRLGDQLLASGKLPIDVGIMFRILGERRVESALGDVNSLAEPSAVVTRQLLIKDCGG